MRTLICIDIDGTLTAVRDGLSEKVIVYLAKLVKEGHSLAFVTGRTLSWSMHLLKKLPFSYYLAALNGAYIIHKPENKVILKQYLSTDKIEKVLACVKCFDVAVVLYQGPDASEKSHFFSKYASRVLIEHLEARKVALQDSWSVIDECKQLDSAASIRIFCLPHTAKKVHLEIEEKICLHAPMMKDSYDPCFTVVQVTDSRVSKGNALAAIKKYHDSNVKVIACGDDHNDISMLQKADCAVVMNTAPSDVLELADIIAPSARDDGIIIGLKQALSRQRA